MDRRVMTTKETKLYEDLFRRVGLEAGQMTSTQVLRSLGMACVTSMALFQESESLFESFRKYLEDLSEDGMIEESIQFLEEIYQKQKRTSDCH